MLYLALYCTSTIIILINIFWEKRPEKWMTKDSSILEYIQEPVKNRFNE
jgi:hypothetical protein